MTAPARTRSPVELVAATLAHQGMPREEIRTVLGAGDPETVRRRELSPPEAPSRG